MAPWAGGIFFAVAVGFLYGLGGPWWKGTGMWTAQWSSAAQWERWLLLFLWPGVLGAGALQGLRERRSGMRELLASTPRPAWRRAVTTAGALAILLAAAYLLVFVVAAVQVVVNGGYFHLGWVPVVAVGVLAVVAGGWLGMGVGRTIPSVLTPPALAVTGLVTMIYFEASNSAGTVFSGGLPHRIGLLSPSLTAVRDVFLAVSGRVHLGQAVWLAGIAATGLLLLAATRPRARLAALLPLALGTAVAPAILPAGPATYVKDAALTAPVCDGPVCVTRLHEPRLAVLAGPGREALRLLGRLPDPPVAIRETDVTWPVHGPPPRTAGAVPVDFGAPDFQGAAGERLTRSLVAGAGTPPCFGTAGWDAREQAARTVAAAWFLGDLEPLPGTFDPEGEVGQMAASAWDTLRALPAHEQVSRMSALRTTSLSCDDDLLSTLTEVSR
ncbi:hypothetical protein [Microtetraspora sp. NBRC 13810]|uniref:hypothetical protein n=1 Tax=Microtetraspora sp. NBRC 13810 TaxID=3030990 RepID=UPI002552D843|nr:hypothetical protein [Microtetraspora sp. NBRC 13810]